MTRIIPAPSLKQLIFIVLIFSVIQTAYPIDLGNELKITETVEDIEFARNTQGSIATDSRGNVHIVYTLPNADGSTTNHLIHQKIENAKPLPPVRIDKNSRMAIHPAMTIDHQDNVHVVWHDRRHSTAQGNFFDNVEIFYDFKPAGGSFGEDIRFTNTNADHLGDNGYLPQILQTQDKRLHVLWYDFHLDGSIADAYLRSSDENGNFTVNTGIVPDQLTFASENSGNSIWMPTFAEISPNQLYIVYGQQENFSEPFGLHGFLLHSNGQRSETVSIAETGSSFFDPPRMASDANGTIGLVYQQRIDGINTIVFQCKTIDTQWSPPLTVSEEDFNSSQPDVAFDTAGNATIIWRDDAGRGRLAKIDPASMTIMEEAPFSTFEAFVIQPCITINQQTNQHHIAWVDERVPDEKSIYMISTEFTSINSWMVYE